MSKKRKNEILRWMDRGYDVDRGMALYVKYGQNQNILRRLNMTKNKKVRVDILTNELTQLAGLSVLPGKRPRAKQKKNKPAPSPKQRLEKAAKKEDPPKQVPAILEPLYLKKREKYILVRNLLSKLQVSSDQEERCTMAGEILHIWDEINALWKQIDYHHQHGKLPPPEVVIPTVEIKADTSDPLALDRRRRTLATYISKAKKNPERNQENLIAYQNEVDAIKKLLKNG